MTSRTVAVGRVVRTRGGRVALRVSPRALIVGAVLAAAVLATVVVALSLGSYVVPLPEVLSILVGGGRGGAEFVVLGLRLPRAILAILVGGALGASGALMQGLARNPLASPDLLGFSTGAASGAVLVLVAWDGSSGSEVLGTTTGALLGTLVTALVVLALISGPGAQGYRLVLVGVGVNAMLVAMNEYLITRADADVAVTAQSWVIGTLNGRGWDEVVPVAIASGVLLPLSLVGARRLDLLGMGDDVACSLGVGVTRTRTALLLVTVALVGTATASGGPILFVALAAPQIARRLTGSPGAGLVPAALTGALILVVADTAAQRLFAPTQLPAGVLTAAIGGLYLVWLLRREWRAER